MFLCSGAGRWEGCGARWPGLGGVPGCAPGVATGARARRVHRTGVLGVTAWRLTGFLRSRPTWTGWGQRVSGDRGSWAGGTRDPSPASPICRALRAHGYRSGSARTSTALCGAVFGLPWRGAHICRGAGSGPCRSSRRGGREGWVTSCRPASCARLDRVRARCGLLDGEVPGLYGGAPGRPVGAALSDHPHYFARALPFLDRRNSCQSEAANHAIRTWRAVSRALRIKAVVRICRVGGHRRSKDGCPPCSSRALIARDPRDDESAPELVVDELASM